MILICINIQLRVRYIHDTDTYIHVSDMCYDVVMIRDMILILIT